MSAASPQFRRIALITNSRAREIVETLGTVVRYLKRRGVEALLDEHSAGLLPDSGLPVAPPAGLRNGCDLAIAIGGDGTMLRAANLLADTDVPLLGINRGRLGFLADIPADSVESHLDQILSGRYATEERFQLHCQLLRGAEVMLEGDAFNDIIIQKSNTAKLIELETHVDGKLLHSQRSDGMIVASPTGSTAYALSGGGPILHPSLNALVLVPICPHTLSNRPIVIDGDRKVEIRVSKAVDGALLTCDGEVSSELLSGDRVLISKKDRRVRLIHPENHDHFSILRAKLHWG
jgi:NAD+ kinase